MAVTKADIVSRIVQAKKAFQNKKTSINHKKCDFAGKEIFLQMYEMYRALP